MIQANELRIGNWVKFLNKTFQCGAGTIEDCQKANDSDSPYKYEPIPLTPEILEKWGFISNPYEDRFELGQVHIQYCGVRNMFWIENYSAELKSLHQLQNSTYALTGEELIFKP